MLPNKRYSKKNHTKISLQRSLLKKSFLKKNRVFNMDDGKSDIFWGRLVTVTRMLRKVHTALVEKYKPKVPPR